MSFFGLYIPPKGATNNNNNEGAAINGEISGISDKTQFVFRTKIEALDVLKKNKDARLREFNQEDNAIKYAQTGYEAPQNNKFDDVKTSTAALEKAAFRAPTKQELIEFRKVIESDDYERVKTMIWDNPRYLVSSGDTPTTLKEGYRYNAMHICGIYNKHRIADLILQTVSNPKFVDLLTGKKNDMKMCKELCVNLLDYYLNIPEKGRSETPLHFAVKFGATETIEVLTSYPECRMTPNSEGYMPKDIICSRVDSASPEAINKVKKLLEERFYVPVLRSMDNAIPPQIGQPFSASNPPNLNSDPLSPEVKIQALAGPMNKDQAQQFCRRWKTPPRLGSNTSSPIANNPYISPMKPRAGANTPSRIPHSPNTAIIQRRALFNSTPNRSPNTSANNLSEPLTNGISEISKNAKIHVEMPNDKLNEEEEQKENHPSGDINVALDTIDFKQHSLETNNNHHHQMPFNYFNGKTIQLSKFKSALCQTPIMKLKKESFFKYRDQIASPIIVNLLDSEFDNSFRYNELLSESPGYKERHLKITDTEKGLECIGRELAKEQNIEWREYWDFLNSFTDITSMEGLNQLESYFAQRFNDAEMLLKSLKAPSKSTIIIDDVCSALEKFGFAKDSNNRNGFNNQNGTHSATSASNIKSSSSTTPYTCVEKSLQVFAKRMTKSIIHNLDNVLSINDTLLSELKRLKSLICSFKDDVRFSEVNFGKVHSRIGNLISMYLVNTQEISAKQHLNIQSIIRTLLMSVGERREHLECVCSRIQYMLESSVAEILPENLKTEEMCSKVWLKEKECDCQWEINLSRRTSHRNRMHSKAQREVTSKAAAGAASATASLINKDKTNEIKTTNAFDEWRSLKVYDSCEDDDDEEDIYWSDIGSDSGEEDLWKTPPESPSRISMTEEETEDDTLKIFVYGNEPTKRDLDVLNAIFHLKLDNQRYPHIHSWKSSLLRYPNDEMNCFPSPSVVRKTTLMGTSSSPMQVAAPSFRPLLAGAKLSVPPEKPRNSIKAEPLAKKLFMSPKSGFGLAMNGKPQTPLNKIRGLFSAYREHLDGSPMSSPDVMHDCSDGSKNLSLLNISANE